MDAEGKGLPFNITTPSKIGHFYFALTDVVLHFIDLMAPAS
jgi:hypothetical protein